MTRMMEVDQPTAAGGGGGAGAGGNDTTRTTSFNLFTASIGTLVPASSSSSSSSSATTANGATITPRKTIIQTAQGLRDEHALRRLQKLIKLQNGTADQAGGRRGNDEQQQQQQQLCFDTFILRGCYNFAAGGGEDEDEVWYQLLTLSATVASAIVELFEQQQKQQQQQQQQTTRRTEGSDANKGRTNCCQWRQLEIWDAQVNGPLLQVLHAAKKLGIFRSWEFRKCNHNPLITNSLLRPFVLHHPTLKRLRLDGAVLDLALVEVLNGILLDCTTATTSSDILMLNGETRLEALDVRGATPTTTNTTEGGEGEGEEEIIISAFGDTLRRNHTLIELSVINLRYRALPPSLPDSLMGHPTLKTLNLSENYFSEATLMALGRVLHHPSCQITSLALDKCNILTKSRCIGPLRIEMLADALAQGGGDCHSLAKLSLKENSASSRDLRRLLQTIRHHCTNLRILDMSQNRIERIMWDRKGGDLRVDRQEDGMDSLMFPATADDTPSASATSCTFTLVATEKKPLLQCLWLTRNHILHNRFRSRSPVDNAKLEALLLDFPALGQIVPRDLPSNSRLMAFPTKIHILLAFHHAARGKLSNGEQLPLTLWTHVLGDRIAQATANVAPLLLSSLKDSSSQQSVQQKHRLLARTCQASVLFLLLKHHPNHVTREACRTLDEHPEEECPLGPDFLAPSPNLRVRSKRRKIS